MDYSLYVKQNAKIYAVFASAAGEARILKKGLADGRYAFSPVAITIALTGFLLYRESLTSGTLNLF